MSKADILFLMVGISLGLNVLNIVFAWPRTKLARLKLEREEQESRDEEIAGGVYRRRDGTVGRSSGPR